MATGAGHSGGARSPNGPESHRGPLHYVILPSRPAVDSRPAPRSLPGIRFPKIRPRRFIALIMPGIFAVGALAQTTWTGSGGNSNFSTAGNWNNSIAPANDSLFSSGTLGRYSSTLKSVMESHQQKTTEAVAAD